MGIFSGLFGKNNREVEPAYLFSEPKNTACFTCRHVLEGKEPILYVAHDADDGAWQFFCGGENHSEEDAKIVSLAEITTMDPSVNALHDMPEGVCAERSSATAEWKAFKL